MTNVDPAVTFTCYYMYSSAKDPVQKPVPQDDAARLITTGTPVFRGIKIKNLTATCTREAGTIIGLPESKISGVIFENVKISAASGMKIENAADIEFKNSHVAAVEGQPFLLRNAQVDGAE
jgi:hypothetical protein